MAANLIITSLKDRMALERQLGIIGTCNVRILHKSLGAGEVKVQQTSQT